MSIEVKNVSKRFNKFTALDHVNLEVASGELLALLGPSGSGKTTLLRVLAGLESADEGRIFLNGEDATEDHVRERRVGFVFQHYALFRHMTIFDNIAFGLRVKEKKLRPSETEIARRVNELLELIQLNWVADRFPHQLSGGQRQRVALARALAVQPRVLLLDEPFGALDAKVRQELRTWLRRLHDELHITSVFVTHDQEEALEVSDRIVILDKGRIVQVGSPAEVYHQAISPFVYEFIGPANRIQGKLLLDAILSADHVQDARGLVGSENLVGYVRPYDFHISASPVANGGFRATLDQVRPLGQQVTLLLQVDGYEPGLRVQIPFREWQGLGLTEKSDAWVNARHIQLFAGNDLKSLESAQSWHGPGAGI